MCPYPKSRNQICSNTFAKMYHTKNMRKLTIVGQCETKELKNENH